MVLLGRGDFEAGWAGYHWHFKCPSYPYTHSPQPAWDGTPLDGRTILVQYSRG